MTDVDVIGIGEAMVLLTPPSGVDLARARQLDVSVAGAELNVCVAVAALGGAASFCSRVGDDALGEHLLRIAREHGVGSDLIATSRDARTGLLVRDVLPDGQRRTRYDRAGSAASTMDESDAHRAQALRPGAVVVSGLTIALGEAPARCVRAAVLDRRPGTLAVVDANLRPDLGPVAPVATSLRELLPSMDGLKIGTDEGRAVLGSDDPPGMLAAAGRAGVTECVVTGGSNGAWVLDAHGHVAHLPAAANVVVDPVGAGDAFLGAYLLARLHRLPPVASAELATRVAGLVVGVIGDLGATEAIRALSRPWDPPRRHRDPALDSRPPGD